MYQASSRLIWWGVPASTLGAVLLVAQWALYYTLGPAQGTLDPWEVYDPLLFGVYNVLLGAALLLFSAWLAGLYARRAERSGWPEKVGSFLALSAGALAAVSIVATLVVAPWPGFLSCWYRSRSC